MWTGSVGLLAIWRHSRAVWLLLCPVRLLCLGIIWLLGWERLGLVIRLCPVLSLGCAVRLLRGICLRQLRFAVTGLRLCWIR